MFFPVENSMFFLVFCSCGRWQSPLLVPAQSASTRRPLAWSGNQCRDQLSKGLKVDSIHDTTNEYAVILRGLKNKWGIPFKWLVFLENTKSGWFRATDILGSCIIYIYRYIYTRVFNIYIYILYWFYTHDLTVGKSPASHISATCVAQISSRHRAAWWPCLAELNSVENRGVSERPVLQGDDQPLGSGVFSQKFRQDKPIYRYL